mgnify:CR=1 FL=1
MMPETLTKSDDTLHSLELSVEELIRMLDHLKEENRHLKQQRTAWMKEKSHILNKYQKARIKVEGIISRLNAMEHADG